MIRTSDGGRVFRSWLVGLFLASSVVLAPSTGTAQDRYFPARGEWATSTPEEQGMDGETLKMAINFALENQNQGSRDLAVWLRDETGFGTEPFFDTYGPTTVRAAMSGLVIRHGKVVAEWGETHKVDMTFSVSKSFLSTVVGLAYDRGLVRDLRDHVVDYMPTAELFSGDHNRKITWDHLLRQTSDWRGTLFEMPAWADRPARSTPEGEPATFTDIQKVPLSEPGTVYEYNDVRVNLLALAALNVWREPLPQVLRKHLMDRIGASNTWRWHGYRNSWVEIDGQKIQSVSGGGHWGGGMHISAHDMARFGYLFLNDGVWDAERIISEEWIEMARTPGPANAGYGFMNWMLNSERENRQGETSRPVPQAPDAIWFSGAGSNLIFFDRASDVVIVVRWIGRGSSQFFGMVLDSIQDS